MSVTHFVVTAKQVKSLQALIDAGFAVVVFTPDELSGVNPRRVEQSLHQHGQTLIERMKK